MYFVALLRSPYSPLSLERWFANTLINLFMQDAIQKSGRQYIVTDDMESVLADTDVLYQTRIQKERFETEAEYEAVKGKYKITASTLKLLKERMCILHPLPRVDEISPEV